MRVLFDQGTPDPLRALLTVHNVSTAYEKGWSNLRNGDLLNAAERDGYEVLVSTDTLLKYQQNLSAQQIGIVCFAHYELAAHPALEVRTAQGNGVVAPFNSNAPQRFSRPIGRRRE